MNWLTKLTRQSFICRIQQAENKPRRIFVKPMPPKSFWLSRNFR